MATFWSTWGLKAPRENEIERLVLLGGGRALALGVAENKTRLEGAISDRHYVTSAKISKSGLTPRRGDIVFWRAIPPARPQDWYLWGAPTRVLRVADVDDQVEMFCLEDADLIDATPAGIDHELVRTDRVIADAEMWQALRQWHLFPCCSRCGGAPKRAVYGLTPAPVGDDEVVGGCVISLDDPRAWCRDCAAVLG